MLKPVETCSTHILLVLKPAKLSSSRLLRQDALPTSEVTSPESVESKAWLGFLQEK